MIVLVVGHAFLEDGVAWLALFRAGHEIDSLLPMMQDLTCTDSHLRAKAAQLTSCSQTPAGPALPNTPLGAVFLTVSSPMGQLTMILALTLTTILVACGLVTIIARACCRFPFLSLKPHVLYKSHDLLSLRSTL